MRPVQGVAQSASRQVSSQPGEQLALPAFLIPTTFSPGPKTTVRLRLVSSLPTLATCQSWLHGYQPFSSLAQVDPARVNPASSVAAVSHSTNSCTSCRTTCTSSLLKRDPFHRSASCLHPAGPVPHPSSSRLVTRSLDVTSGRQNT